MVQYLCFSLAGSPREFQSHLTLNRRTSQQTIWKNVWLIVRKIQQSIQAFNSVVDRRCVLWSKDKDRKSFWHFQETPQSPLTVFTAAREGHYPWLETAPPCDRHELYAQSTSLCLCVPLQRAALGPDVTRITLETFLAWKKRKRQEKVGYVRLFCHGSIRNVP